MPRTTSTRTPAKMSTDWSEVQQLMSVVIVGHVGMVDEDGHPAVFPTAVVLDGERLLLHGSTGSPWLRRLATGVPVSVAVTSIDAVVVARTAFESSLSYRSAVFFGQCRTVPAEAADAALAVVTDRIIPGRVAEVRRSSRRELAATLLLELPVESWSLRISSGPPTDEPEDIAGDAWAGNLPIVRSYGQPAPSPDLRHGIPVPASVAGMLAGDVRV